MTHKFIRFKVKARLGLNDGQNDTPKFIPVKVIAILSLNDTYISLFRLKSMLDLV